MVGSDVVKFLPFPAYSLGAIPPLSPAWFLFYCLYTHSYLTLFPPYCPLTLPQSTAIGHGIKQ